MSRAYERLTIETFGQHLLETGDLDPVYVALNGHDGVSWDREQKARFLVAYWCLYHCGAASYLSEREGQTFWIALMEAARNALPSPTGERWPRGHERRHWRGQQAIDSCRELANLYRFPEDMVTSITTAGHSFAAVSSAVQVHRGFGPWIAFKVCDMLDRCLGHRVDFTEEAAFNGIFKDPVEAALQVWRVKQGLDRLAPVHPKPDKRAAVIHGVIEYLREQSDGWGFDAPPRGDRPINVQEVETILCKWKSHMNGHYPLYNDIREIRSGCMPWAGVSEAASQFITAMPP